MTVGAETSIDGLVVLEVKQVSDERGTVRELFRRSAFDAVGAGEQLARRVFGYERDDLGAFFLGYPRIPVGTYTLPQPRPALGCGPAERDRTPSFVL